MPIWILTIGNSDVQLHRDELWTQFYDEVINSEQDSPEKKLLMLLNRDKKERRLRGKDSKTDCFPAPPRVLGLLYRGDRFKEGKGELAFPLLKTFCEKFDSSSAPSRVIVLLTDQTELFSKRDRKQNDCPFWQDTCELREIIKYFFEKLAEKGIRIEPQFAYIKPHNGKGIDNWNEMLEAVSQTLDGIDELKPGLTGETIYVSHQAGTPAISSAVQFASISKFPEVKFLVSNQSYDGEIQSSPDIISSSKYWQGLQIQKAKKLILRGEPGAALELLREIEAKEIEAKVPVTIAKDTKDKLEAMVARFNIKAEDEDKKASKVVKPRLKEGDPSEFEPKAAAERIVDALDLVEILLKNGSYALGVALLAAAHETFLKAAIIHKVSELTGTVKIVEKPSQLVELKPSDIVEWDNSGLFFKSNDDLVATIASKGYSCNFNFRSFKDAQKNLSLLLRFIVPQKNSDQSWQEIKGGCGDYASWTTYLDIDYKTQTEKDRPFTLSNINSKKNKTNKYFQLNNPRMLNWLINLQKLDKKKFDLWELLTWSCIYKRERENDKRNQLMHNLRGVTKEDVIIYLQDPDGEKFVTSDDNDVVKTYVESVKKPFRKALLDVGLRKDDSIENQLEEELKKLAAELS